MRLLWRQLRALSDTDEMTNDDAELFADIAAHPAIQQALSQKGSHDD